MRIHLSFMVGYSLFLAILFYPAIGNAADPGPLRPNILMIVSEDNGPHLRCYGDPYVKTPNLDRLAASGVRFDRAYVPQAGCSQSRAAVLTGLYPHQNGQIGLATWSFRMFDASTPNIIRSLKNAGYRTGILGKLHIEPASAFPFDMHKIPASNFSRKHLEDYAKFASEFFSESEAPFFLSVNYPDPHREFIPQVKGLPKVPLRSADVLPFPYMALDFPKLRKDTANYYNCMSRMDSLVGDLLTQLELSGKSDNTLIIYFGDHGADLLRGKRTSYEGGTRVPLIIQLPKTLSKEEGLELNQLTTTLDLAPTMLEIASAEKIKGLPGRSLLPLLRGENPEWREYLMTEFHLHSSHNYYPQRTIRNNRFKLIHNLLEGEVNPGYDYTLNSFYPKKGYANALQKASESVRKSYLAMQKPPAYELYDLQEDPYEFNNLATLPQYSTQLESLKQELLQWQKDTNDPFLNPEHVLRLQKEIAATKHDGKYEKPDSWEYLHYLHPSKVRNNNE